MDGHQSLESGAASRLPLDQIPAESIATATARQNEAFFGASVFPSVQALSLVSNLLRDTRTYLETIISTEKKVVGDVDSNKKLLLESLQLPCQTLQLAIDGLDQHSSIISKAMLSKSSSVHRQAIYVQSKLLKSGQKEQTMKIVNKAMIQRDPKVALALSMNHVKENLAVCLSKTNPDFIVQKNKKKLGRPVKDGKSNGSVAQKRQRIEQSGATEDLQADSNSEGVNKKQKTSNGDEGNNINDENNIITIINLPKPMTGNKMFTPVETVAYIQNLIDTHKLDRSYIRAYKEKMIAAKLVPIQMTQLNNLLRAYGGVGKHIAPLSWKVKGPRDKVWESILLTFQAKQLSGQPWSVEQTQKFLTDAALVDGKKRPSKEIVESRHRSLLQLHHQFKHANEQLVIQNRHLKALPPKKSTRKSVKKSKTGAAAPPKEPKPIVWDKDDEKYKNITLPKPADGNLVYTPTETVKHVWEFMNQTGPNKPSRSAIRYYKEKMIAEKLVPVSITQVNFLVKEYGSPGKGPAPASWNEKGRKEFISMNDLVQKVKSLGRVWTIDDTLNAIWTAKRQEKSSRATGESNSEAEVKRPDTKTVSAYHTALMSMPEIARIVAKPPESIKPGKKDKKST